MEYIYKYYYGEYSHAARAGGAIERLGEAPNFGLTALGLGEEGLGGKAVDSLVRELLC